MKVVQINSVCGVGSTGVIAVQLSQVMTQNNIENYILYTNNNSDYPLGIRYSDKLKIKISAVMSRVLGNYGFNSYTATLKLIRILKKIKPDIVHIHNVHGHDLNLGMLLKYLKKSGVRVICTLHDCWLFTGYCTHFDYVGCGKWQTECKKCPQRRKYTWFFDRSKKLYNIKRKRFSELNDVTVVTPSNWLAETAKKSFLGKHKVAVINNGINLEVFKPSESDFRDKYGFGEKRIIMGIPKGNLKYFVELSKLIDDDYSLVLVGLTQDEIEALPKDILGLPYQSSERLAEIFTATDVYVNTTMADTFPTVNIEALACGTPVVTFRTGGSPETIDENTGISVEKENVCALYEAIKDICNGPDRSKACIDRAHRLYNKDERFNDYIRLYKNGRE